MTSSRVWCPIVLIALFIAQGSVAAEVALTNDEVIRMVKAGLSDALVVAKIQQAEKVAFDLEVDHLIGLREAGVSETVVKAMLDRSNAPVFPAPSATGSPAAAAVPSGMPGFAAEDLGYEAIKVALEVSEGTTQIRILRGELSSNTVMGFGMMFMDYPGLRARTRTRDRRPSLLVRSSAPLTGGRYFLGKLDSDEDDGIRSLKVSSAKGRLKAGFGGSSRGFMEPDHDWVVEFKAEEAGPDLWRVTPAVDLEPGEYGWYADLGSGMQGNGIFDFGVDP